MDCLGPPCSNQKWRKDGVEFTIIHTPFHRTKLHWDSPSVAGYSWVEWSSCPWQRNITKSAPTSYKWSCNPYKWITGVITSISGFITLLTTGRGPLWSTSSCFTNTSPNKKVNLPFSEFEYVLKVFLFIKKLLLSVFFGVDWVLSYTWRDIRITYFS